MKEYFLIPWYIYHVLQCLYTLFMLEKQHIYRIEQFGIREEVYEYEN